MLLMLSMDFVPLVFVFISVLFVADAAPPGPNGQPGPNVLENPNNQQYPVKMQMHPGGMAQPNPALNTGNLPANINQEQGPIPAAATNYDSYSSYGGGGGYGGAPEYSNDNYGFDCYGKKPALYGDANYDCRIYHVCQADGRSDTIKCPKWTRFNNYLGICDWHFKVDNYCNPLPDYKADYGGGYQQPSGGGYQQGAGGAAY